MNSRQLTFTLPVGLLVVAFTLTGCSLLLPQQSSPEQEHGSTGAHEQEHGPSGAHEQEHGPSGAHEPEHGPSGAHEPEPGSPEHRQQLEEERAQAAEQQAQRAQQCEPEDGEERFEFMPLGTYEASNDTGSGTMTMRDDYSLRLNWIDHLSEIETNVHAEFMWQQEGIGEVIQLCNVEAAPAGEIMEDLGDTSTVVLGVDEANHSFRFDVPDIGEVEFTKIED